MQGADVAPFDPFWNSVIGAALWYIWLVFQIVVGIGLAAGVRFHLMVQTRSVLCSTTSHSPVHIHVVNEMVPVDDSLINKFGWDLKLSTPKSERISPTTASRTASNATSASARTSGKVPKNPETTDARP